MQVYNSVNTRPTIKQWLNNSPLFLVTYISLCSFVIYTCMYGFRKPYTVGTYNNIYFLGISYKVCLVMAQVVGYAISKFYGIRFISGMLPKNRVYYLVAFIGFAWLSLLLFGIIPAPYNIICLFLNGLPLGMVFGLVFGFLEGRRTTEIMGAFLATSFIFASGLAKTIGKWLLLTLNINDWWMPFAAGAFFVIPFILSVSLLNAAPPPSKEDIEHRTARMPMNKQQRKTFIKTFGWALTPMIFAYVILTIVRDFCEDFVNELWIETGYQNNAGIFAKTSTIVSLVVLLIIASFFFIKNNYKAFIAVHFLIIAGVLLAALSTLFFTFNFISPISWMLMATTGLYLGYLPYNCLYFERLLSTYKLHANVGFVMYIADAFGYLGTIIVLLIKEFTHFEYSWVSFFSTLFFAAAIGGVILVLITITIHKKLFIKYNHHYETK